jgi:fucose permease
MFLRDELGAGIEIQGLAFAVCALGGALGLAITDRLLQRVDGRRLLMVAALACALTFAAWLSVRSLALSVMLLGLVGVTVAPLYPIAAARAYAARPGQPGLVAAVDQLFGPFAIVAPLAVGVVADRVGIVAALALLVLQPVGVGLVAVIDHRVRGDR